MTEKHVNVPVFIPHEGCKNDCVFCNQRTITGVRNSADRDIRPEIDRVLATYGGKTENAEIAFFGGSFTGIERPLMIKLLDVAYEYVKEGKVSSVRLSTRPDYIDEEILEILKSRGVTDVELGLQSMRNSVLLASNRGHTAECSEKACALIKKYGFILAGQMMIGLPSSTLPDEIYTAEKIVSMRCDCARIYPTVVFEHTKLCEMAKSGVYTPLTVEEAVNRSAAVYEIFVKNGVKVLRIGLQATEALTSSENVYAGANHSALGELVIGEYYARIIRENLGLIAANAHGKRVLVLKCAPGEQSKVAGQKKKNVSEIKEKLKIQNAFYGAIKIIPDQAVPKNTLQFEFSDL
ncbi:MAG: radical SAM protein [Clostridia bacterium]|nr:radical SAM protein [Clostridia bacterium]